jgi:hypothetical protein
MTKPDLKYLSNFEKKYDLNLWELAINERIFYRFNSVYNFSSDEILSIIEHESKLFDEILTESNPDFLIMFEPTLHQEELLYRMCKKRGIKILLLNQPNISRSIISENPRKIDVDINLDKLESSHKNFDELKLFKNSLCSIIDFLYLSSIACSLFISIKYDFFYLAVHPASTIRFAPVMYDDAFEHKKIIGPM